MCKGRKDNYEKQVSRKSLCKSNAFVRQNSFYFSSDIEVGRRLFVANIMRAPTIIMYMPI